MSEEKSLKRPWHNLVAPICQEARRRNPGPPLLLEQLGKPFLARLGRWGAGVLIAGALLILAHGCHSEEVDDEPAITPRWEDQRPPRLVDE
jgi:hypothetical protein